MKSQKYNRTYHYPFSLGTTSDDRINNNYWQDIQKIKHLVHTEKLDGENNCLNKYGVYARSHATPTQSAWTNVIRQYWQLIKNDLGDIELFGENLYAVHSICYPKIDSYFYLFAVRHYDQWLSWEEVEFYAQLFDLPIVPVINVEIARDNHQQFQHALIEQANQTSLFGSIDVQTHQACSMEGIVTRNTHHFTVTEFSHNVFKYVRKNHVKTSQHWKKNWQRAPLSHEKLTQGYDHEME